MIVEQPYIQKVRSLMGMVDLERYTQSMPRIVSLYSDGGCYLSSGSETISWAWIGVDANDNEAMVESGICQASEETGYLTNNQAEFLAMLRALEAMPNGWSGQMCSDSGVTIGRFSEGWKLTNIPDEWVDRMHAVKARLGNVTYILHKGHPTLADLERGEGQRKPGGRMLRVSIHQDHCDKYASAAIQRWAESRTPVVS